MRTMSNLRRLITISLATWGGSFGGIAFMYYCVPPTPRAWISPVILCALGVGATYEWSRMPKNGDTH
jgi:hypothetical protein